MKKLFVGALLLSATTLALAQTWPTAKPIRIVVAYPAGGVSDNVARALAVVVLITASFVYVVAQIVGVGIITQRFLDVSFTVAVFLGLAGYLLMSLTNADYVQDGKVTAAGLAELKRSCDVRLVTDSHYVMQGIQ